MFPSTAQQYCALIDAAHSANNAEAAKQALSELLEDYAIAAKQVEKLLVNLTGISAEARKQLWDDLAQSINDPDELKRLFAKYATEICHVWCKPKTKLSMHASVALPTKQHGYKLPLHAFDADGKPLPFIWIDVTFQTSHVDGPFELALITHTMHPRYERLKIAIGARDTGCKSINMLNGNINFTTVHGPRVELELVYTREGIVINPIRGVDGVDFALLLTITAFHETFSAAGDDMGHSFAQLVQNTRHGGLVLLPCSLQYQDRVI